MKHLQKLTRKTLGDLLIDEGLVTQSQVTDALEEHRRTGYSMVDVFVTTDTLTEWDVAYAVANQLQLPFIHPANYKILGDLKEAIPPDILHRNDCVPLDRFDDSVTLCVSSPIDPRLVENLQKLTGCALYLYVGLLSEIRQVLDSEFPVEADGPAVAASLSAEQDQIAGEWEQLFDLANESVLSEQPETEDE